MYLKIKKRQQQHLLDIIIAPNHKKKYLHSYIQHTHET